MQLRMLVAVGGLLGLATSALADAGVRPVWTDFQPAVSTQYRPPDGGRSYPKPDTRQLISTQDQRRMQRFQSDLNDKLAAPARASAAPRRPARMKDPLALPPEPSTTPSLTPPKP